MRATLPYIFALCATACINCLPIIIHDKNIDAPSVNFVALPENRYITPPHMTYIPQQLMVVRNHAKRFPVTAYPLCKRACYIKCVMQEPQQEIELFIRKEKMDQRFKEQSSLEEQDKLKHSKNKIIRFYRKIDRTEKWKPILSMPEEILFSHHTRIIIQPDGTLQIHPHL